MEQYSGQWVLGTPRAGPFWVWGIIDPGLWDTKQILVPNASNFDSYPFGFTN